MIEVTGRTRKLWEDIVANEHVKRAFEVALAGSHSFLLVDEKGGQGPQFLEVWEGLKPPSPLRVVMPCPCGNLGHPAKSCNCLPETVNEYREAIPLHRSDIMVRLAPATSSQIMDHLFGKRRVEPLSTVVGRVNRCARHDCMDLDETTQVLLHKAIVMLSLSVGQVRCAMKVARAIANLADSPSIQAAHVAEAIQYIPIWER